MWDRKSGDLRGGAEKGKQLSGIKGHVSEGRAAGEPEGLGKTAEGER